MKRIYLDHAAATPIDPSVLLSMKPFFQKKYVNPSSLYTEGVQVRKAVEGARMDIAKLLSVHSDEIVFTGSATESANLALVGSVNAWKISHPGKIPHIIISSIEHEAILEPARWLEKNNVNVSRLSVDKDGIINIKELNKLITLDTVLIAVMLANNEIGTIQPLRDVAKIVRKWKKDSRGTVRSKRIEGDARYPLIYTDACQAANYIDLNIPVLGVDMMTLSGAKLYGPKGAGLLYVARDTPLVPLIIGGGQERGLRAGTENVPAIIGFAKALTKSFKLLKKENSRLSKIQTKFINELIKTFPDIIINGSLIKRLPNNINFSFSKTDHEFLVLALDAKGVAVSSKSACSETDEDTSHVLMALRQNNDNARPLSGIRVTMGRKTTSSDMKKFVTILEKVKSTMF